MQLESVERQIGNIDAEILRLQNLQKCDSDPDMEHNMDLR